MRMFDIQKDDEALEVLNGILQNRGIAEVKVEKDKIIVVEIKRMVRTSKPSN